MTDPRCICILLFVTLVISCQRAHEPPRRYRFVHPTLCVNSSDNAACILGTNELSEGYYESKLIRIGPEAGQVSELDLGPSIGVFDIDFAGNILRFGNYSGALNLPYGEQSDFTSNGESDLILLKCAPNGDLIWAKTWGGPLADVARYLTSDMDGNIIIVAVGEGGVDVDPGPEVTNLSPPEPAGYYLSKFDPDGNYLWAMEWGLYTVNIHTDAGSNVYITGSIGSTHGAHDSDTHAPVCNLLPLEGSTNGYVAKISEDGELLWIRVLGSTTAQTNSSASHIATGPLGEVYMSGGYAGVLNFDLPDDDLYSASSLDPRAFICKYSSDGEFQWARAWTGSNGVILDIAASPDGSVILTGEFYYWLTFVGHSGEPEFRSSGSRDAYLARFDPDGNCTWGRVWGGADMDRALRLATDDLANIYVLGSYHGPTDFCPGEETEIVDGYGDYVSKFNSNGDFLWVWTDNE